MSLDLARILESVEGRYHAQYRDDMRALLVALAVRDQNRIAIARRALERTVTQTMGIGEALGAAHMLRMAAGVLVEDGGANLRRHARDLICFRETAVLAEVSFTEALDDLVERTPVFLKDAAARTAQNISKLYSEGRVMAFAKSAEQAVTNRVQDLIIQAVREGIPEAQAGTLIRMGVDKIRTATDAWSDSYSRLAFRNNVNTAVTAGRFRQSQDQDVKQVIPCFRFDAVGDVDTRHNHMAADGRIYKVDNPVWNRIAPPLGHNCRCQVSLVSLPMLRRMGRVGRQGIVEDSVPPGAYPDPGFRHGGRPDLFMVGGAA